MMDVRTLIILIKISLSFYFLLLLFKFLYKFVWNPIRIQNLLHSQGIKGPSYKFPYGSTTESNNMIKKAMSKSIELSHDIFPRVEPHIYTWSKTYGMNFVTWFGPKAQLVVTEPELVKEILTNRDGAYSKTDVEGFAKKVFGYGLVTAEGEKWAKQRKLAKNGFHAESLKGMIPAIISSVETMLERWVHQEGKETELYAEFKVLTFDVISKTAFGSSYLEGKSIYEMLMKLKSIIAPNIGKVRFPGIGKFSHDEIESEKLVHGIREYIIKVVKERGEKVNSEELDGFIHNYLDILIKAYQDEDENKRISIDDVVDEIKTFYLAGQETTTSLLTWTMFLLALHTDWQEKARNEVFELFGQENPTSYDNGIIKLKMMSMIINESLRLYPPVLAITRKVAKKVKLGEKLILPPNIELIIRTLALHHDQEIWGEDVHHFKPERFAEGLAKASNNTSAFLPFGLGPRSCLGLNLATLETKIVLSMILQRYSFSLSPIYVHSPVLRPISRPQYGVQVILQPLHAQGENA